MSVITVAIPTLNRGEILLQTLQHLAKLNDPPNQILVVDQTRSHPAAAEKELRRLDSDGRIRWIRLSEPSIPAAMNRALSESTSPVVLFLDDDVIPGETLITAHRRCYGDPSIWAVTGQVIQPWNDAPTPGRVRASGFLTDLEFPFNSTTGAWIENAMAGNLSVRREKALQIGGFDENFVGAAYRFETDFAKRLIAAGGKIWFEPGASIRHLKHETGGLRTFGHHLRSASPAHTAGEYYFAMMQSRGTERVSYIAKRLARSVTTRYHLRHPWWIPFKLIGEVRALVLAARLARRGRRLVSSRA